MSPENVSVVICTKDRPQNLLRCIPMVATRIPSDNIYVFEGSLSPNFTVLDKLKDRFSIKIVFVPYLRFGAVRNLVMRTCKTDFVAMVDDDIRLEQDWFKVLMGEFASSKVVAASAKLVFGDGVIAKMCLANKRRSGGSGGAAIYRRKAILELGNFDMNIHRGEDAELELRIWNAGKKWVKNHKTRGYHPLTLLEFLDRPKANVCGWDFIMKNSKHRVKFMAKRFASTFVMPIYYFWVTLDPRCAGLWFLYKMKALLYYLSRRYLIWS